MREERWFKSNTYLTDGKNIIKLGSMSKPDWTPQNNYGRKRHEYMFCKTFPENLFIDGIQTIQKNYMDSIPGLWFQEGYHLNHFKEIDKKLINENILGWLEDL